MNTVTVTSAKELKSIIRNSESVSIEGHPSYMTGLECSNAHCSYYSADAQGEVYIKFPVVVNHN